MNRFIPSFAALFPGGLLAGAFLYAYFNVVPTFSEVPLHVHLSYRVQLMKHNGLVMQLLMAASFLGSVWFAISARRSRSTLITVLIAAALALESFLITRFGNVPINQLIKTWNAENPPADWATLLAQWDWYHAMRTLSAVASFLTLMLGLWFHIRKYQQDVAAAGISNWSIPSL